MTSCGKMKHLGVHPANTFRIAQVDVCRYSRTMVFNATSRVGHSVIGLQPNAVTYTTYSCMSTPVQCIEAKCSTSFKQQVSTETGEGAFVEVLGAFAALKESAVEIVAFQRFGDRRSVAHSIS